MPPNAPIFTLLKPPVTRCPSCAWVYLKDAEGRYLGPINGSSFTPEEREALLVEIMTALNCHEAVVAALADLTDIAEDLNDVNSRGGQYACKSAELRGALEAAHKALLAATPAPLPSPSPSPSTTTANGTEVGLAAASA